MKKLLCCLSILSLYISCDKAAVQPGNDPNFTIVAHNDPGFEETNRKVVVFDIPIYAFAEVEDSKLLHAANIMAQYIDNNEDGIFDNELVWNRLKAEQAALFLWKNESQISLPAQDLGNDETILEWHQNGQNGRFDATLEEVWHVITHSGYSKAYPTVFGETAGTALCNAMDIARGGQYTSIPNPYPANAWYTYDDGTCTYNCMATEYFYWGMSSILGAQSNRLSEIQQEWDFNTASLMQSGDSLLYSLLTDPQYKFPTVLPDGSYKH